MCFVMHFFSLLTALTHSRTKCIHPTTSCPGKPFQFHQLLRISPHMPITRLCYWCRSTQSTQRQSTVKYPKTKHSIRHHRCTMLKDWQSCCIKSYWTCLTVSTSRTAELSSERHSVYKQGQICHRYVQWLQLKLLLMIIHQKIQGLRKVHRNPTGRSDLILQNQPVS